jgi:PKD repeat protein
MTSFQFRRVAVLMALLLCLVGMVAADPYVGGIPLETVQTGTVSGGVYIDAENDWWPPNPGVQDVEKTFATIPNVNNIAWARLYVSVYCGHMQNNYQGTATISFDGNGDYDYTDAGEDLGTETMNVPYSFPHDGGSGPVTVNDHMNRVTSDYLMWYDVTSLITSQTPNAHVVTSALDGSFDGRIKMITLVVAYNDGDTDTIYYRVNQGHDTDTYYDSTGYVGYTEFDLNGLSGTVQSATLMVNHMASSDGTYAWYGDPIDSDPATGNSQGAYFGYNIWDLTSAVTFGNIYDLTYDRTDPYYKIPLAILTVKKQATIVQPVADFSATPLSGTTPLTVQFTDLSTGPPTSWEWRYSTGGSYTTFSTQQNPSFTFSNVGTYSIRLKATNSQGDNTKTKSAYIVVTAPPEYDLTVTAVRPNGDAANTLFAREANPVAITIRNDGGTTTPATTVSLTASDGVSATADVPAIAGSSSTTVTITDNTIRDTAGVSVTYTATVDPSNTVTESDETDNTLESTFTVTYNGYKGKRYWSGGSDVVTRDSFDLNGGLLYSSGDSTYHSGSVTGSGWSAYTVTWMDTDLPVPSGTTVKAVYLYVPYTWDSSGEMPDRFDITFNSNPLTPLRHSEDRSNFGAYPDHDYGLLTYDVTPLFNTAGNSAYLSKDNANTNVAMYGLTLAVVYEDPTASRKQIFLNDEFDLLGASVTSYGTTEEESTAYVPFSGLTIVPGDAHSATLITFVPSGNGPEGDLLFNGETVASDVWDYGLASGTQVAVDSRNVLLDLEATGNEAGIRSSDVGSTTCMAISHAFLIVDYSAAPVAGFSATPTSGYAPLTVQFTDESTNGPTSWSWNFGDGQTSADQNPGHIYTSAGTFTVSLTTTNAYGSDTETKTSYITTTGMLEPVVEFSATPRVGTGPLSVTFTDATTSEGAITSWVWEYREVTGSEWTQFSTDQNPSSISFPAGTYDIRLTATNAGGSGTEIKTTYIASSAGRLPLTTVTSGMVSGDLYVWAFQPVPWGSQSATPGFKEFTQTYTIPAFTNIQWARLYTSVYAAGTDDRAGRATVIFDGNGDGTYESALGIDNLNVPSTGDKNAYTVNDHGNRVYSDYLLWYDVTSLISSATVNAKIVTENIDSSTFDGRVKTLTLVVAYNDGDSDEVWYWVNQGHDYQSATDSETSTAYATALLAADWTSAELTQVHLSSKDAAYSFNSGTVTGADPTGGYNYFGKNVWDVTSAIHAGSDSTLTFTHATDNSYKTPLSVLKVRYTTPAPLADFTPATPFSVDRDIEVTFTDASTGSITTWDMDFGDGSAHGSGPCPWSHTYTTRGSYDVSLTVIGPGGTDPETKTGLVTVTEPAPNVDFTGTPLTGQRPLTVVFDATKSGGSVNSWKWEYSTNSVDWTQFATIKDPTYEFAAEGTYDIRLTATGPDSSDTETKTGYIQVGAATIDITVNQGSIGFGTMAAGVDEIGSTTVNVDVTAGTAWSVTAAANNGGYMSTGTVNLANPFQLSNDGTNFQAMTSNFANFMNGAAGADGSDTADVKQAIASADAPGDYTITVIFMGAFV